MRSAKISTESVSRWRASIISAGRVLVEALSRCSLVKVKHFWRRPADSMPKYFLLLTTHKIKLLQLSFLESASIMSVILTASADLISLLLPVRSS